MDAEFKLLLIIKIAHWLRCVRARTLVNIGHWLRGVAFKLIGRDLDAERDARDEVRIEKRLKEIGEIKAQHEAERMKLLEAQQRTRKELIKLQQQQDLERRREQDKDQGIVRARLNSGKDVEKDRGR